MFKLFGQRHNKDNHEINGASIRSLIQRAVKDAEQITDSIKVRAQAEAENEAARTIDQARQGAEEIKRSAEAAAQKEVEGILSAASRRAELAETEAKQNVRSLLLKARQELAEEIGGEYKQVHSRLLSSLEELINEGQDEVIEQPVRLEEEAVNEKAEEPLQLEKEAVNEKAEEPLQVEEEATLSDPVGATTDEPPEQHLSEEKPGEEDPETTQLKWGDSQALYTGEIELAVVAPVELKTLTKFYNYLQTIPDIKILYTRGSWDSGTTITVALDNPIPFISFISQVPGVAVVPELFQKDKPVRETPSSLLRTRRSGVKRLKLALREE